MGAEAILRAVCDRCGSVHEQSYDKNVANFAPDGWDRWSRKGDGPLLICPACIVAVRDLITQPLTHVGWASASGSGLSFTGLASKAKREGYLTRVYVLGKSVARRQPNPTEEPS